MENGDLKWMDDVRIKLKDVYQSNVEDLVLVFHYLDEEDKKFYSNPLRPYSPKWNSLKSHLNDAEAFKGQADKLIEECRRGESIKNLAKKAQKIINQLCTEYKMDPPPEKSIFFNLAKIWSKLPPEITSAIIDRIKNFATNTVGLRSTLTVGVVALSGVQLGCKVYQHIKRWWNGEIGGKRCAKYVVDDTVSDVAGTAGAIAGAFYGSSAGPRGAVLGGFVGGFVGGVAANALIDRITQYIFGLPKSEALSNAYQYLGVPMTASNSEVNRAFDQLCSKHHPDKGGNKEEFFILQCHMSVIRQARDEY